MSKVLNTLKLNITACLILLVSAINYHASAQCRIVKKTSKGITRIETIGDYQYFRSETQYAGILIKTIISKKISGASFGLAVTYTGAISPTPPKSLVFTFQNGESVICNLTFIRKQKIDNIKQNTEVLEAHLSTGDISHLKMKPLLALNVIFTGKNGPVNIPVADAGFMQNQLACLQNQ